jgi:hypothetical protein
MSYDLSMNLVDGQIVVQKNKMQLLIINSIFQLKMSILKIGLLKNFTIQF